MLVTWALVDDRLTDQICKGQRGQAEIKWLVLVTGSDHKLSSDVCIFRLSQQLQPKSLFEASFYQVYSHTHIFYKKQRIWASTERLSEIGVSST